MIIDGKKIAEDIIDKLSKRTSPKKFLAIFTVAPNSATLSFLKQKELTAKKLGVDFRIYNIEECINNDALRRRIGQVVLSKKCGGAILQLPIPKHLNPDYVVNIIPQSKDVEVITSRSVGDFYKNRSKILPPSASTLDEILTKHKINLNNIKTAVVIGCGELVGKPIISYLTGKVQELIVLDKGSSYNLLERADLVVSGAGSPKLINYKMLNKGSIFIDFGYSKNLNTGKLVGDLDVSNMSKDHLKLYTPTPGGTGPILVAKLFENFYKLNKK